MEIESRTYNPGVLQAMRTEAENPPAIYEQEPLDAETTIEEQSQSDVASEQADPWPELVIEDSLLDRVFDGIAGIVDQDIEGFRRRTAQRLRRAPEFLRTITSGLISPEEKAERDSVCEKCEHVVVSLRLIDGDRRVRKRMFCGGCDCPRWWLAELRRYKNWFRGHQCPRMKHPKTDYGIVTIWRWIKSTGFKGRLPESIGRR